MQTILPWIGGLAALLTSLSYVPQVKKAWPRGSTDDLSLRMLIALNSGLVLWVCYGLFQRDWIIVSANCAGAALAGAVLICKLRDVKPGDMKLRDMRPPQPQYDFSSDLLIHLPAEGHKSIPVTNARSDRGNG
jgi:MtN3 and saliva related transmembrane protein